MYVYQGKTYARKRLYKTSSLKTMLIGVYIAIMLVVIGGVAAWSLGVSITLPNFLLGIEDTAPMVQVRERGAAPVTAPAAVATTTEAEGQVETSVEVLDDSATSTATTTDAVESVQTSAEVLAATSTEAETTP